VGDRLQVVGVEPFGGILHLLCTQVDSSVE
jgi:hypothetical protein